MPPPSALPLRARCPRLSDGLTVTARGLADLITADRYLAAKAARGRPFGGAVLTKILPAGPFPDGQGTGLGGVGSFDTLGGGF